MPVVRRASRKRQRILYVSIFPNARIVNSSRYGEAGTEGSVMTVVGELDGQEFIALNGGRLFLHR